MDLKTLETHLEEEVKRWENSAIKIGELLNQIKESEVYKEAGYTYFQTYYRERWEQRIGRVWSTVSEYISAAKTVKQMQGAGDLRHPVTDVKAATRLGAIEDPAERVEVWNEHVESGEKRAGYHNLNRRIREHKVDPDKTVNENLRDAGVEVPDSPEPTVGERLTPKDFATLPTGKLSSAQKWHYDIGGLRMRARENPAEVTADCLSAPDMLDSHIEAAEELSRYFAEYADALKAKKRGRLRAVKDEVAK